jgi:DNA-binding transcriptional LysR family regulator
MNQSAPDWNLYRSFLAVLREKSLSGAARALALTQPTLARHIDALEAVLGFELFTRSQHGLAPTQAALELQPYAESLEANSAALLRTASGLGQTVKGTVRITASEVVGAEILPPILATLRRAHPALEFEIVLSDAVDNLLRGDADMAVRMVEPRQEALVVRKLGSIALGLYARRDYLAASGQPQTFGELARHSLIGTDHNTPALRSVAVHVPGLAKLRFALRTDSTLAQLRAIQSGFGIGVCQVGLAARDPELLRLLPEAFDVKLGVWLAMHENLRSTLRCRAAFEGLARGMADYIRGQAAS